MVIRMGLAIVSDALYGERVAQLSIARLAILTIATLASVALSASTTIVGCSAAA
jgi:hypothetical protein